MVFGKKQKKLKNQIKEQNSELTNPIQTIFSPQFQGATNPITDSERLINAWLNKKHLNMKTTLSQNQINSICILMSLARQFKISPLKNLLNNFIMYMISKESESAKQLVSILESRGTMDQSDIDAISKFSK